MKKLAFYSVLFVALLSGSTSCDKIDGLDKRLSDAENSLSLVTLNIVPDYSDGSVRGVKVLESSDTKSYSFSLDVTVTPAKFGKVIAESSDFVSKAVFSPLSTKGGLDLLGFALTPKSMSFADGAGVPYIHIDFDLDPLTAAGISTTQYAVSFSVEDKDGMSGASTPFVPVYSPDAKRQDPGPADDFASGMLPGKFSAGDGLTIRFSKGNLRYVNDKWSFEDEQYQFHTRGNDGWGLFGWSGNNANYGMKITISSSDYRGQPFKDWGKVFGEDSPWFTLSKDQWTALLKEQKHSKARVNGVNGLLLFPNGWESYPIVEPAEDFDKYTFDAEQFKAMQEDGAVFLPCAGCGYQTRLHGTRIYGYYWTSTYEDGNFAFEMRFDKKNDAGIEHIAVSYGDAVRLVMEEKTLKI
ncbi:MAG: hypothetical protein Q4F39_04070 [Bacteroidia bacterium]|nr:hypothetical protein [Bacteroidia bacterium]